MSLVLIVLVAAGLVVGTIRATLRNNATLLKRVEAFDRRGDEASALAEDLGAQFDASGLCWREGLAQDGITIHTTFTPVDFGKPVRAYRVTSWLDSSEISVDRMVELLDGGFLSEDLWHKEDYQGGACLETLHRDAEGSDWVAQYISAMKPFRLREFVYLLSRREMEPRKWSRRWHPADDSVVRQVCIGYRSVPFCTGNEHMVRAIQYPSLDRITSYESGKIRWEHIMVFHIAGVFPQWLTNRLMRPAMNVLLQEALNMRNYCAQL